MIKKWSWSQLSDQYIYFACGSMCVFYICLVTKCHNVMTCLFLGWAVRIPLKRALMWTFDNIFVVSRTNNSGNSWGCGETLTLIYVTIINTLMPRQDDRHFAADIFKCIFLKENVSSLIEISLKFVLKGPINNISALIQVWLDANHYLNQWWWDYLRMELQRNKTIA